jgi:hypothetical protein
MKTMSRCGQAGMPKLAYGVVTCFLKFRYSRQLFTSSTISIILEKIASLAMDSAKPFRFLDLSAGMMVL